MKKGTIVIYNNAIFEIYEKKGNTAKIYNPEADNSETTMQIVTLDEITELRPGDKVNKIDSEGNQLYYYGLSGMKYKNAYMLRLGTINDNRKTAGNYKRESISA